MLEHKVVIPNSLKLRILNELHSSHLGVVKTKRLEGSYIWWPNMNEDIEKNAKSCNLCKKKNKNNPPINKLIPWEIQNGIWDCHGPNF